MASYTFIHKFLIVHSSFSPKLTFSKCFPRLGVSLPCEYFLLHSLVKLKSCCPLLRLYSRLTPFLSSGVLASPNAEDVLLF